MLKNIGIDSFWISESVLKLNFGIPEFDIGIGNPIHSYWANFGLLFGVLEAQTQRITMRKKAKQKRLPNCPVKGQSSWSMASGTSVWGWGQSWAFYSMDVAGHSSHQRLPKWTRPSRLSHNAVGFTGQNFQSYHPERSSWSWRIVPVSGIQQSWKSTIWT